MLKIVKKYSAVILISATASLCVPSVAQACQLAPCASAHQSSTRISVESGVRVYRGTVHRQDYKTQLKYNAQRERAAKAQALRDKRAAERRASIAEANRLKAEQALTSRPQRRRTRQRFTTFSNSECYA